MPPAQGRISAAVERARTQSVRAVRANALLAAINTGDARAKSCGGSNPDGRVSESPETCRCRERTSTRRAATQFTQRAAATKLPGNDQRPGHRSVDGDARDGVGAVHRSRRRQGQQLRAYDHFDLVRENGAWKVIDFDAFSSRITGCPARNDEVSAYRQSRGDRMPRDPHRAEDGDPHRRGLFRCRRQGAARAHGGRGGAYRAEPGA